MVHGSLNIEKLQKNYMSGLGVILQGQESELERPALFHPQVWPIDMQVSS